VNTNSISTIDKRLAHKWSVGEVLLTGFSATADGGMRVTAYVPQSHLFYNDQLEQRTGPDFAVIVEMCRQACFLVAHELLGVPQDKQFLLRSITAAFTRNRTHAIGNEVELQVAVSNKRFRGADLSGLAWDFSIFDEKGMFATASFDQVWVDREPWRRTRHQMRLSRGLPGASPFSTERLVPPTDPASVGRSVAQNVVIGTPSSEGSRWSAVASLTTDHPTLFDHPIDHVYGMVQLEIARQLSLCALSSTFALAPSDFALIATRSRYLTTGELDLPLRVVAELSEEPGAAGDPQTAIDLEFWQEGRHVSSFTQHYLVSSR